MRVDAYLATGDGIEEPDPDRALLEAALCDAGLEAPWPSWTDAAVDWSSAAVVFPRSTWDYYENPRGFLRWVDDVDAVTRLRNPRAVIHWNIDKSYLGDLQAAGIPCVPTRVVARGSGSTLSEIRASEGWERVVVKPAISCGSWHTYPVESSAELDQWAESTSARDMLVQPFIDSVATTGERCAVLVDGELTHVVRKNPRFAGGVEATSGPFEATDAERRLVEQALEIVEADLDYARVDMVQDNDGEPMIAELELIEPSLFFPYSARALERFIALIERYNQQS